MAISQITVKSKDGDPIVIRRPVKIATSDGLNLTRYNGSVTLRALTPSSIYTEARDKILSETRYLSRINNTAPGYDGIFWLRTDSCVSWGPAQTGGVLSIDDPCVPVNNCEAKYRALSALAEAYILMNALKDVNFYSDSIFNTRQDVALAKVKEKLQSVPGDCYRIDTTTDLVNNSGSSVTANKVVYASNIGKPDIKSNRLLAQLGAVINMWNYLVEYNGYDTTIDTAPEDTTGIVIRTKRATPSCGNGTIKCVITVKCTGQSGLSFYVPETTFVEKYWGGSYSASAKTASGGDITVGYSGDIKIETKTVEIEKAGTFMLTAKVLPFKYVQLVGSDGNKIALKDVSYTTEGKMQSSGDVVIDDTSYSGETLLLGGTGNSSSIKVTEDIYNTCKSYPSQTADNKLTWEVDIKWIVTNKGTSTTTDLDEKTFYYQTSGVREYLEHFLQNSEYIKTIS